MSWRYCSCGCPMEEPTIEQDLEEGLHCVKCGKQYKWQKTTDEWLLDLHYRLKDLEEKDDESN